MQGILINFEFRVMLKVTDQLCSYKHGGCTNFCLRATQCVCRRIMSLCVKHRTIKTKRGRSTAPYIRNSYSRQSFCMSKITNTKAGVKLIVSEKSDLKDGKVLVQRENTEVCNCYSVVSSCLHDGNI